MSEANTVCDSFPRAGSNGSINSSNNNNNNNSNVTHDNNSESNGTRRSPLPASENQDKPRASFLDNPDQEAPPHRRNSSHGLDLSKPLPSTLEGPKGLDLTKSEPLPPGSYSHPSDSIPFTNGIPSDTQPTPASVNYGPVRSHSAGEAVSPFRADSVPNGYSPDNLTNGGDYKSKFLDSFGISIDPAVNRFPERYGSAASFDPISASPGLMSSTAVSPSFAAKITDSYIAAKLAENSPFPRPQNAYSKILEDFGNNARNNNNNDIPGSKLSDEYADICGKLSESPYRKIAESYAKQIESLTNGYKSESSIFKQENSPGSFKVEPNLVGNFPKSDSGLTNGSSYDSITDSVSSSSQPSNQSLPSIINFSANPLRGIAAAESGLAGYLNSYGVGGAGAERSGSGGGGREGQSSGGGGGGGSGSDSNLSRSSPNNKLACRFCGKTFSQAGYIKAHERLHTGEKPFACSVCGKRFSDPSNWKKHERVHANNKKQGHILDSHESKVKNFFMKSMTSLMTSSLQQRLAIRPDPGGPITCKICGKMFSSQSSLSTHKRIHTGERPYRCTSCGKCFTQIGTLRTHERIHTGEKPYICKVCGRTFAQSGSYRMHERRHMTDSVQRCHICYATFTSWQELQRHMASHPQVTQAILEFEEGNQGIMGRSNAVDLGGQLGDGSIGQLGQSDGDVPGHGHVLLSGDCGPQRELGLHHPRCPPPPPLVPESLFLESEASAFHVQPQGLYHPGGQLPPFSSILPFRHHPGAPPTFPPSFPPGLGLLGPQSLPVTSHADLLTKHPFFGAMIGASQIKHDALTKLSPTYSPQQQQVHQHSIFRHQQHMEQQQQQQQHSEHGVSDGTDVVSTTSKRADAEQRNSSRPYTPEERSDTETLNNIKDDKEGASFGRSVSSDEGLHSPDDNNMDANGDEEMMSQDHDMAENENDDDADFDERNNKKDRGYSNARRFSQNETRSMGERERESGDSFGGRNRSRSFDRSPEKERRDFRKERKLSGDGNSKSGGSRDRDFDYKGQGGRDSGYAQTKNNRNIRNSIRRHDQFSVDNFFSPDKNDNTSSPLSAGKKICSFGNGNFLNLNDNSELRPLRRNIERQNLNTRMMHSSSSRKQPHPMRRVSSAGSEQESPQSTSSGLPVSSTTAEAMERGELDDNELVAFLLNKGRVHKCVHCHMIFQDASLFLLHNGFHSHDDPFKCVICTTACKDRIDFNCHLTSHIK